MYKRMMVAAMAALLLLGCERQPEALPSPPPSPSSPQALSALTIDPPHSIVFATAQPFDFCDYFSFEYETALQRYLLGEGTDYENEVTVLTGAQPGASVYVVAGLHGDEEAAWRAGELLKKSGIKAGSLYILAPANKTGASAQPPTRFVFGQFDLNRSFPGEARKNAAEQMANTIFEDVRRVAPALVLDLHEAQILSQRDDFLGSSLIFTELGEHDDFFLQMILETQQGTLCSHPFDYFSPAPSGSLNKTVSQQLSIPVITVETFRGYEMERRLADQLDIVGRVLTEYGML